MRCASDDLNGQLSRESGASHGNPHRTARRGNQALTAVCQRSRQHPRSSCDVDRRRPVANRSNLDRLARQHTDAGFRLCPTERRCRRRDRNGARRSIGDAAGRGNRRGSEALVRRPPRDVASCRALPNWRRRPLDRGCAAGFPRPTRHHRHRCAADGLSGTDGEASPHGRSEPGVDRPTGSTGAVRTAGPRQGARPTGCAADAGTCPSQRRPQKGNCGTGARQDATRW